MEFVHNSWYPIAFATDVDQTPRRRVVLGKNIVLFRDTARRAIALEDLCPHRFTPLSLGRVKGDAIECGYHGMTFDGSGRCIAIPGQDKVPSSARVKSFPVKENMGIVWVWPGNADLAESAPVFNLLEYHDANYTVTHGQSLHIAANYQDLCDNLVDPAHVSFVHLSTLGNAGEGAPVRHEQDGDTVTAYRWTLNSDPVPLMRKFGGFHGKVDRWQYYYFYAPSISVIELGTCNVGAIKPGSKERNAGKKLFACHFMTPVDEKNSVDHWLHVRNFAMHDDKVSQAMNQQLALAFDEDKAILEAIQQEEDALGSTRRPLRIAIDGGVVRMRQVIDGLLAREAKLA